MKITDTKSRILELMELHNLNQTEFCEKTNINKSALSNYLNGDRIPRQDQISKIADAFHVSPSWLMGYDVPMIEPTPSNLPVYWDPGAFSFGLWGYDEAPQSSNDSSPSPPKEPNIVSDKEYEIIKLYRNLTLDEQEIIEKTLNAFSIRKPLPGQINLFNLLPPDEEEKKGK